MQNVDFCPLHPLETSFFKKLNCMLPAGELWHRSLLRLARRRRWLVPRRRPSTLRTTWRRGLCCWPSLRPLMAGSRHPRSAAVTCPVGSVSEGPDAEADECPDECSSVFPTCSHCTWLEGPGLRVPSPFPKTLRWREGSGCPCGQCGAVFKTHVPLDVTGRTVLQAEDDEPQNPDAPAAGGGGGQQGQGKGCKQAARQAARQGCWRQRRTAACTRVHTHVPVPDSPHWLYAETRVPCFHEAVTPWAFNSWSGSV